MAALLSGCAALGGGGGGGENLPNRGAIPYEKVMTVFVDEDGDEDEVPWMLTMLSPEEAPALSREEPSALVVGGEIFVWYSARDRSAGTAHVEVVRSSDGGASWTDAEIALLPSDGPGWLGDAILGPAVVRDGDGFLMAFEYGPGAGIGLATSSDGLSFMVDPNPLLEEALATEPAGLGNPSLVALDDDNGSHGRWALYYEVRAEGVGALEIRRALAGDDLVFSRAETVLQPGVDCIGTDGKPEGCFDADGVGGPEVRLATTGTGRRLFRMFYTGFDGKKGDLGFASSDDGVTWGRFPFNPVVDDSADERGATNVLLDDVYLLVLAQKRGPTNYDLVLARGDAGFPSETF